MPSFQSKIYQLEALDSISAYFRECQSRGHADFAFQQTTKELWGRKSNFTPLKGFPEEMPYFCLRVPTGGGKTYLAAKSVSLVNDHLLHTEHSVILWLVPSTAIRRQTMDALKNLDHPYHAALCEAGPVTVIDLDEAKSMTRSTLESSTVVIVATRQAFQISDEEQRKVYENNGSLMSLFDNLTEEQSTNLLKDDDGNIPFSLVNALRLRRPFVIVDEAHNSRTELSFETLAKFHPSGIMELTATPDIDKTPSNVLHSVSAVELKRAEMIKLPILLETEPDHQRCLAIAIDQREQLQVHADKEHADGAPYLRPLVLIQSEPKSANKKTRHAQWVKDELMRNHNIPENEIVIATGSERGLETVDADYKGGIFSKQCPVKFIITQKALAEGWDCAFAYILVSMAELRSSTAVEQLLGRILRQPQARRREAEALNRSYAYAVSKDFGDTAKNLRDSLVEASGFNREEAADFVSAKNESQIKLDFTRGNGRVEFTPMSVKIPENLDISKLSAETKGKIKWNKAKKELLINAPLSKEEAEEIQKTAILEDSKEVIRQAGKHSRTKAVEIFTSPSELGASFLVPQMAVMIDGELRLFDEPEALDYPWELPLYNTTPSQEQLSALLGASIVKEGGFIDIDEEVGRVTTQFARDLQRDLSLSYKPEHWNEAKLSAWFCRQIHDASITHASKRAYISAWLSALLEHEEMSLARVNSQKFLLRSLIDEQINGLRKEAVVKECQQFLFGAGKEERVRIGSNYQFEFHPDAYAPLHDYDGKYGDNDFQKHYYPRIGDFDSEEEYQCACWLDRQKNVEFWVRNLVRKDGASFYLQNATSRFYPDFVCKLTDGRILIVEYKGLIYWDGAKSNRLLGDLWAELSGDQCLFVMLKEKKWEWIAKQIDSAP